MAQREDSASVLTVNSRTETLPFQVSLTPRCPGVLNHLVLPEPHHSGGGRKTCSSNRKSWTQKHPAHQWEGRKWDGLEHGEWTECRLLSQEEQGSSPHSAAPHYGALGQLLSFPQPNVICNEQPWSFVRAEGNSWYGVWHIRCSRNGRNHAKEPNPDTEWVSQGAGR